MSSNPAQHDPPDEHEIVRWGDQQNVLGPVTEINPPKTIQLVKVHRNVPETWTIELYAFIHDTPAVGPAFDVTVSWDFYVGAGSTQVNLFPTIRMQAAAAAVVQDYSSLVTNKPFGYLNFQVPARDIQIICTNVINNASPAVNVQVAAFAAPRFSHPTPGPNGGPPPERPHEWMPEGFNPEPLRYR